MWAEESECLDLMSCYIFLFFKPAGDLGFAFPGGGTLVKNLPANAGDAGDVGSIPQSGRSPGVGNGNPLQYSCLDDVQRSLAGYSPWSGKESDVTEATARTHA